MPKTKPLGPGPTEASDLGNSATIAKTTDGPIAARVLCIDDEPALLRTWQRSLDSRFGLTLAASGREGLEALRKEQPFSVIVCDLKMPEIGGIEVLAQAQEIAPFAVRILLTGAANVDAAAQAINRGQIFRFLIKPISRPDLEAALDDAVDRHRLLVREHRELAHHRAANQEQQWVLDEKRERIESALGRGFDVAFQPIVDLSTGRRCGVEALSRFGFQPHRAPDVWFNEAAEVGLGVDLELMAVANALAVATTIPDNLPISLNISPPVLFSGRLGELIDPLRRPVVLELINREPVVDYDKLIEALEPFRAAGFQLAINAADASFSDMTHIARLQPDIVKLDSSLINGLESYADGLSLVRLLADFATQPGATIWAEDIETAAQAAVLRKAGVQLGQGCYFGRPIPSYDIGHAR